MNSQKLKVKPCLVFCLIYVGAGVNLYAIYPDGTEKWNYATVGPLFSSPVLDTYSTVYIGSIDSCLYAIDSAGNFKWKYQTNGMIMSSPAVGRAGTIYVGSFDNYLYAINDNGTFAWRYPTGGEVYSSPAVDDSGVIYFGSSDTYLYALRPNGSLKWRLLLGGPIGSSPAISPSGTIYIGADDGYLYTVNQNGNLQWQFEVDNDGVYASPIIGGDGTIYIGGRSYSMLYAIYPDGTEKWRFPAVGSFYGSFAIDNNGIIYYQIYYPAYLQAIKEQSKIEEKNIRTRKLNFLNIRPSITPENTTITFNTTQREYVSLAVYNSLGRKVSANDLSSIYSPGTHKIELTIPDENGIYFVGLKIGDISVIKKLAKVN